MMPQTLHLLSASLAATSKLLVGPLESPGLGRTAGTMLHHPLDRACLCTLPLGCCIEGSEQESQAELYAACSSASMHALPSPPRPSCVLPVQLCDDYSTWQSHKALKACALAAMDWVTMGILCNKARSAPSIGVALDAWRSAAALTASS